jgi:hypothetical protein
MSRAIAAVVISASLVGLWLGEASADRRRDDRPMHLELGLNTRHFAAADPGVAFRTTETPDPAVDGGSALSTSIRFTGRTRFNTFLGAEAEAGTLLGRPGSNLAGAYGVAGAHHDLANLRFGVEMVAGQRWVRYGHDGRKTDPSRWIAEPRVRADLWLGPHATLGGAVGATLSDRAVWMAGIYIGMSSSAWGRWR